VKLILDARKSDDYGIGVYLTALFSGLIESRGFDCRILHLQDSSPFPITETAAIAVKSRNYNLREHWEIPQKIKGLSDHLYFSPHYVFPLLIQNRLLVTIHDVIHFKFPQFFGSRLKVRTGEFFIRQAKKRAELIFTVSHTTKRDLEEMFAFPSDRIRVVYSGIAEDFFSTPTLPSPFPFPYLVTVSNLKPHKNIPLLLEAYAAVAPRYPDLRLILVGITPDKNTAAWLGEKKLQDRVICKGYVTGEELVGLIDGAEFLVHPSLYEGFGFPPLEAMSRGRAVISSTGGSLKEILADNALFFSPASSEELAECLVRFLDDPEKRAAYAEKGRAHSRNFRWSQALEQYREILQHLDTV
jgi:glycosyltransferase involved in cell wall biosynthesis